jgi:hypothetical protein
MDLIPLEESGIEARPLKVGPRFLSCRRFDHVM